MQKSITTLLILVLVIVVAVGILIIRHKDTQLLAGRIRFDAVVLKN